MTDFLFLVYKYVFIYDYLVNIDTTSYILLASNFNLCGIIFLILTNLLLLYTLMLFKSWTFGMFLSIILATCIGAIEEFTFPVILNDFHYYFPTNSLYIFCLFTQSIGQVIGSVALGYLTNRYGTRIPFIISLFGMIMSYTLSFFALMNGDVLLFVFSRIIAGLCICMRAITDTTIVQYSRQKDLETMILIFELLSCLISIFNNYLLVFINPINNMSKDSLYFFLKIFIVVSILTFIVACIYFRDKKKQVTFYKNNIFISKENAINYNRDALDIIILLCIIYLLYETAFTIFEDALPLIVDKEMKANSVLTSKLFSNIGISGALYSIMALIFPRALVHFNFLVASSIFTLCVKMLFIILPCEFTLHITAILGFLDRGFYVSCTCLIFQHIKTKNHLHFICSFIYFIEGCSAIVAHIFLSQLNGTNPIYAFYYSSFIITINLLLLIFLKTKLDRLNTKKCEFAIIKTLGIKNYES